MVSEQRDHRFRDAAGRLLRLARLDLVVTQEAAEARAALSIGPDNRRQFHGWALLPTRSE
ncbi:MAG TPA: hypothetical protein VFU02_06665 [Polyangiaceae bacterium]|nr:hypothetical protein [Polyangiaceae bacterium]